MIRDCIENNFEKFIDINNYKVSGRRGCVNRYYKKKLPHFNMFDQETMNKMKKRINKFYYILNSNEKKLFIHIIGIFNENYLSNIINILNSYSSNYNLL
jgi:hypothetical protein